MLYKFLKKVGVLYLVTIIAMLQMVCLPESSKEIEKARARDNKTSELEIVLEEKRRNSEKNWKQTKIAIEDTKKDLDVQLDDQTKNKRLSAICKKFLQEDYMPYLKISKEYYLHMAKYEEDIYKKREYKAEISKYDAKIRYVEILLQKGDPEELCKYIVGDQE